MDKVPVGIPGLLTIVVIVAMLFESKTLPSIAFILFPSVLALVLALGGHYTLEGIASLTKEGFKNIGPTAALFVFSVLFFGIMTDADMFDVIVGQLMKLVDDNVIGVMVMTVVIAMTAHMDGVGAVASLIVIPMMLPVYKKIHMRATSLLHIMVLAMGALNLMPWTGPTMCAAPVLSVEVDKLWNELLPIQISGVILVLGHAVLTGFQEKARSAGLNGKLVQIEDKVEITAMREAKVHELTHPKLSIFNILLTAAVITMLIQDMFPSYIPFMPGIGTSILVNYTDIKLQKKVPNAYAVPAFLVCTTLMGTAILMDILIKNIKVDGTEIPSVVSYTSSLILVILSVTLGAHPPLVIDLLSVPLALAFDTDSYSYSMLPIMMSIGQGFGIPAPPIAASMIVCRNCAAFISLMVPVTLLGVGLAEVDIKDHTRTSFFHVWGFSFLCMIFAITIDIIPAQSSGNRTTI